MVGSAVQEACTQTCKHLLPESRHEVRVPVQDDLLWYTKGPDHAQEKQVCCLNSSATLLNGHQGLSFVGTVHHGHDPIMLHPIPALCLGQAKNEVHGVAGETCKSEV